MNKKIIWLADFTTLDHQGGAQQTNKIMIDRGREKGLDIDIVKCEDFDQSVINDDTIIIINNITLLSDKNLQFIIDNAKYVRYCHDYSCINRLNNFPEFYDNSLLNIFVSPLHHIEYKRAYKYNVKNIFYQNSPVDTKKFYIKDIDRKHNEVMWVGQLVSHKGINNVAEYAKENPLVKLKVYGFGTERLLNRFNGLDNVEFLGEIDHDKIPEEYNKFGSFIHLPEWKEPFGRTILEAYLCGCDLIVNDNLGCMSFGWDYGDYESIKKECKNSPNKFWKAILNVIN